MNTSVATTTTNELAISEAAHADAAERPLWNPYVAGVALGLVLLATFLIMGRGLGASGAFSSAVAVGVQAVAPEHVAGNGGYLAYLGDGTTHPLKEWLVFEVIGVLLGGLLSGLFAGRAKKGVEKGPNISVRRRLAFAFVGGGLTGFGARLARGCTSGQALTGGALLNAGSWAVMLAIFVGAYGFAYFIRRQWL